MSGSTSVSAVAGGALLPWVMLACGLLLLPVAAALLRPRPSTARKTTRMTSASKGALAAQAVDGVLFLCVLVLTGALALHGTGVAVLSAVGAVVSVMAKVWFARTDRSATRRTLRFRMNVKFADKFNLDAAMGDTQNSESHAERPAP